VIEMFWEKLDRMESYDFFKEIEDRTNLELIKSFLKYVFQGDESYFDLLKIVSKDEKEKDERDILIQYLTLVIVANTRYYNLYIKNYVERYFKKIEKTLDKSGSL